MSGALRMAETTQIRLRAGGKHVVERLQIDAADGKPRHGGVRRRPADIVERHGFGGGLGAGGVNRADGNVIRTGVERALRLRGRVGAQTNAECGVRSAEFRTCV